MYDQNEMGLDLKKSMADGIINSKVFLACVNSSYQTRANCMFELREAKAAKKEIIALPIESNPLSWCNAELNKICAFADRMYVDLGGLASMEWEREEGPSVEMLSQLHAAIRPLISLLNRVGCSPSMKTSSII